MKTQFFVFTEKKFKPICGPLYCENQQPFLFDFFVLVCFLHFCLEALCENNLGRKRCVDITREEQTATAAQKKTCNIYGEAVVAAGRAEWDIKLDFEGYGGVTVGLWRHNLHLAELPLENEQFVNFENGYGFTNKTGEFIQNKERKTYSATPWKRGSVLTLHLDLTSRTLSYSIDGKSIGLAKDCLPRGAYRLAAKMQFKEQRVTIERFWTSLEGVFVNVVSFFFG
ncbi:hypothetical protein RFI_03087 [Reticulomyxa filosa]|uniref:B30.2/SPRY domain-containing protein n=1 Tax=Reticulomyxa filosa TaxID=46433 RepID=X6P8M6_RETFI|nr:hypothetical protein RFI_03087 [Reticulomyxa filosa]|eukprot:ETO34007.1 hypothetical protein RFI_03087 [Reticulomyxa filosa]